MKNTIIKSRRAQVLPEALILLVTIAICTYAFSSAYTFEADYSKKLSVPTALIEAYQTRDGFEMHAMDAAKLSMGQSLSNALKSNPECTTIANEKIPIWTSDCVSNSKFDEAFQKEINSNFKKLLNSNNKYKVTLGDKINFEFEPTLVTVSGESYKGIYQYQTNFLIENPVGEDPSIVYQKVTARMNDCKNSSTYGVCINKLVLEDYASDCLIVGKYLVCSLTTKQNYFLNDSFGKIESKFAINL